MVGGLTKKVGRLRETLLELRTLPLPEQRRVLLDMLGSAEQGLASAKKRVLELRAAGAVPEDSDLALAIRGERGRTWAKRRIEWELSAVSQDMRNIANSDFKAAFVRAAKAVLSAGEYEAICNAARAETGER